MKNETARREIEALDYYLQNYADDYSEASHKAMMMAVDALSSLENPNKWIPCSEGSPKKDGRYYVTRHDFVTRTDFTDILWYEKGVWWNRQSTGDYAVTAWMPLPEPYKADMRGEE